MHDVRVRAADVAPVTTIVTGPVPRTRTPFRRGRAATGLSILAFVLAALCLLLTVLPGTVLYAGAAGLGSALAGIIGYLIVRRSSVPLVRIGAGVGASALLVGLVVPIGSVALDAVPML